MPQKQQIKYEPEKFIKLIQLLNQILIINSQNKNIS